MKQIRTTRTVYTVGQLLSWMRSGNLELKPTFQRREVWKKKSKSLLIDTVVRGLPMPLIFLRQKQDLETLDAGVEVVDGQQRLRTLFSFIDPTCLDNFDKDKDEFTVSKSHYSAIANTPFGKLDDDVKQSILEYEISTHVFPPSTSDAFVLRIFARMNSTGLKLNPQEIRNAEYAGEFKTLAYDLAFEHLDYWRKWSLFSDDQLARMQEVEAISDFMIAIMGGISGKSKTKIDRYYKNYDDEFPDANQVAKRLRAVLLAIDEATGTTLSSTRFTRPALFYSLFTACYDYMYGLGSSLSRNAKKKPLPASFSTKVERLDRRIKEGDLPEKTVDAMEKATADIGRRKTRHLFFQRSLGLESR
jgi:hypothetical protein